MKRALRAAGTMLVAAVTGCASATPAEIGQCSSLTRVVTDNVLDGLNKAVVANGTHREILFLFSDESTTWRLYANRERGSRTFCLLEEGTMWTLVAR